MSSARLIVSGLVACLITVAWPPPAYGQDVCGESTNLTTNCAFTSGITDWTLGLGHDWAGVRDGHHASGSLEATSSSIAVSHTISFSQCVEPASFPPRVYGAGFWVKLISGMPESCAVSVIHYSTTGCFDYLTEQSWASLELSSSWRLVNVQFRASATTLSIELIATCGGATEFSARFDDFYLGDGIDPPLFADDFETSDTSGWSTVTP